LKSPTPQVHRGGSAAHQFPEQYLEEVSSILATGLLRTLLHPPRHPVTPPQCATFRRRNSPGEAESPLDVVPRESVNGGDDRANPERSSRRRPDSPTGRDPDALDGPAPGGIPEALGTLDGKLEPGMAPPKGELAHPGERPSDVRRRRTSDAGGRGARPAAESAIGCADSGHSGQGCTGSPSSTPRNRNCAGLSRAQDHGNGSRAGV